MSHEQQSISNSWRRTAVFTAVRGSWKWLLLCLGLGIGGAILQFQIQANANPPMKNPLGQGEFELRITESRSELAITDICLHPTYARSGLDEVSCYMFEGTDYEPKTLLAARPYRPVHLLSGRTEYPSVAEYLADAARLNAAVSFTTAWWERPSWTIIEYETLGFLVFMTLVPLMRWKTERERGLEPASDLASGPAAAQSDQIPAAGAQKEADAVSGEDSEVAGPPRENVEYTGKYYPVAKSKKRAFSLIELLVVIGLIVLLAAFLLPVIRTSREHAKTVRCASQLAQIGLALNMYANSNGGWLPAWSGWHTWPPGGPEDDAGPAWTIELIPYLGTPDSSIYNCPSFPFDLKCRNYFLAAQWAGISGRHAMKLSDIKTVSRFVLSGDKTKLALYPRPIGKAHLEDDADPDDFGAGEPVLSWPWTGGFYMHARGNNVLFDDGHVELMQQFDPTRMTFSPTRMEDWADVTPN